MEVNKNRISQWKKRTLFVLLVIDAVILLRSVARILVFFLQKKSASYLHLSTESLQLGCVHLPVAVITLLSAVFLVIAIVQTKHDKKPTIWLLLCAAVVLVTGIATAVVVTRSPDQKPNQLEAYKTEIDAAMEDRGLTPGCMGHCSWIENASWEEFFSDSGSTLRVTYHNCKYGWLAEKYARQVGLDYASCEMESWTNGNAKITQWSATTATWEGVKTTAVVGILVRAGNELLILDLHGIIVDPDTFSP